MTPLEALVLGIVQGVTEFIPISSSGHLVLVPWLLGWSEPGLAYSALLHWGTLLAVLAFFRRDLYRLLIAWFTSLRDRSLEDPEARIAWWIIIGSIPAGVIGLTFQDFFESLFNSPRIVACFLLFTGLILTISERLGTQSQSADDMQWYDALLVGLAQAAAITPGISRSGATIGAGLLRGIQRASATRFSLLLMVPAIFGAGILSSLDLAREGMLGSEWLVLMIGFISATISGYLAIRWLVNYLTRHPLTVFAIYCVTVGFSALLLSVFRG
ncbi:MAG TPA: undecaprenyl-diphosphatase UppP [Anaerolineae bacterium]|nr:undecaprenyl-diphosphatase UppP [Anaerolineae bacterium]